MDFSIQIQAICLIVAIFLGLKAVFFVKWIPCVQNYGRKIKEGRKKGKYKTAFNIYISFFYGVTWIFFLEYGKAIEKMLKNKEDSVNFITALSSNGVLGYGFLFIVILGILSSSVTTKEDDKEIGIGLLIAICLWLIHEGPMRITGA